MDQGARDDQLLPHAVAVGFHQLVLPAGQLENFQQLRDAALHRVAFLAVQAGDEAQKFPAGEFVVDERPVGNEAEPHLRDQRGLVDVVAAEQDAAAGGAQNTGDHPQRRRLTRAVGAEAAVQHAAWHVQGDVVHGDEAAVRLREILEPDHSTST